MLAVSIGLNKVILHNVPLFVPWNAYYKICTWLAVTPKRYITPVHLSIRLDACFVW